jgi:hypothetical protein
MTKPLWGGILALLLGPPLYRFIRRLEYFSEGKSDLKVTIQPVFPAVLLRIT